jgi:hypothetical protein
VSRRPLLQAEPPGLKAAFGKCTHGKNWGFMGERCEAAAEFVRDGFPDRFACGFHANDDRLITYPEQDPGWLPIG